MLLYAFGIPAVAPISENCFLTATQYNKLKSKFTHICLLYDTDCAGLSASSRIHKKYPELPILYIPRKYKAKDISDFYKMYGREKTLELIEYGRERVERFEKEKEY